MEIYEMTEEQKQNRIEEIDIALDNLLNARTNLEKAMNDVSDILEADDLMGYFSQDLRELNHIIDQLNDELQDILDYEPNLYNEYQERTREFNDTRF